MRTHNIAEAHEISLVFTQFPEGFLLPRAILRDTCRFLKKNAAVLRTAVKNVIQSVLSDNAHAVMPNPRICKELIDVLDATARVIQIYLTVAIPIETSLNNNLIIINRKCLISIIKNQYNFSDAERTPCCRTGKDDVLRAQSAQHADVLFAKDPTNRICNVAFSAAIGAHNGSNPTVKLNHNPLGE